MENALERLTLKEYLEKFPHNTDCGSKFDEFLEFVYNKRKHDCTIEEFVEFCLYLYGGTVTGALIDYLRNSE